MYVYAGLYIYIASSNQRQTTIWCLHHVLTQQRRCTADQKATDKNTGSRLGSFGNDEFAR